MAKITIEELSESLKNYLDGLGLTETQVQELIDKMQEEVIGNKAELATSNKSTIVAAINELFQSANNGKELIASAIGEPLSAENTFNAMSNGINGLLSTFKTNMMNNGVVVEVNDKFKQLIDKIAALKDGGGKGVQFVEGTIDSAASITRVFHCADTGTMTRNYVVIPKMEFEPTFLILFIYGQVSDTWVSILSYDETYEMNTVKVGVFNGGIESSASTYHIKADENVIVGDTIYLPIWGNNTNLTFKYYAVGVGEGEDSTLRDSLASILEEEGVEVTEDDTMADLIVKVDEEFDRKKASGGLDIISATELPATGKENQICVITDNPVDKFIVSQFTEDMTDVGDAICLDLATNERSDNRLVLADNGRVKLYYYINRVVQSGDAKETYVYKNNQWVLLAEGLIYLLLDGVDMNNATFGDIYIYNCIYTEIDASTGEICLGTAVQSTYQHESSCFSFANKITIDDYTKISLRIKVTNTEWDPTIVVGLATKAISGTESSQSGYNNWSSTGVSFTSYCNCEVYTEIGSTYPENEYFTLEVDISELTGTGYLCIGIEDNMSDSNWVRINTIGIQ